MNYEVAKMMNCQFVVSGYQQFRWNQLRSKEHVPEATPPERPQAWGWHRDKPGFGFKIWAVLSDEQMSNGCQFSLLNDEQTSNWLGVEHQPEMFQAFLGDQSMTWYYSGSWILCACVGNLCLISVQIGDVFWLTYMPGIWRPFVLPGNDFWPVVHP